MFCIANMDSQLVTKTEMKWNDQDQDEMFKFG